MAVTGYMGWHGQGKTYCAMSDVLGVVCDSPRARKTGKATATFVTNAVVVGTAEAPEWLTSRELRDVAPAVHFDTWDELMPMLELAIEEHRRLVLLVDEAGKFLSSRFFTKLDPRVLIILQERRKIGAGLDLYWTAPHLDHVDKLLRDVSQEVWKCRRIGGTEYSHDGGAPPRAFMAAMYRPNEVSKASAKPVRRRLVPFSKTLASLYTTGVVQMGKPMAAETDRRPDMRDAGEGGPAAPPEAQKTLLIKREKGSR